MSYQEQTSAGQEVTTSRDEHLATHNVFDTLASDPAFSQLAELVREAGSDLMLKDGEWITFLAPGSAAAANLPQGLRGDALREFVRRHTLSGSKLVVDLARLDTADLRDGSSVPVERDGATVRIGGAKVVRADIQCTNGVIHEIDSIIA